MAASRRLSISVAAFMLTAPLVRSSESAKFPLVAVCDLMASPEKYNGKLISMRVEVIGAKRVIFIDPVNHACGRIPWALPGDRDVHPKPNFRLVEDENLVKFKNGLSVLVPPPSRTMGRVLATVHGRFDSVFQLKKGGKVRTADGFGHLGLDESRFVLHRVVDVTVQPGDER